MINNYLSNIPVDIKTSYKDLLLEDKLLDEYFVDIDYVLSEHNIKIRLSYQFHTQYIMESIYNELFFSIYQSNVKEYILKELNNNKSSLNIQLCSEFGYNNHFGICLMGVQFAKIDEEFELQVSKFDKNAEGLFYTYYYQKSCISESLINPASAFKTSVNDLTRDLLKKQSYSKYCCIEEGINNNESIVELYVFRCIEDLDFNVNKDITFATYKYVFETLNNELVHIMNKTSKEVLADIVKDVYERRTLIVNLLKTTVKKINEMKIESEDVALKELINQLSEYSDLLTIENDKMTNTSGSEFKVVHINDKDNFNLMSLYYFNETYNFLEFE